MNFLLRMTLAGIMFAVAFTSTAAAQNEDAKAKPASQTAKMLKELRTMKADAEVRRAKMVERFSSNHPSVKQLDSVIDQVTAELKKLDSASKDELPQGGNDKKSVIESLVRETFQLQTQLQLTRIAKAEADLQRIKAELKARQDNTEKIIANRVAELTKGKIDGAVAREDEAENADSAEELAAAGWAVWKKHNWKDALEKFDAALKKDPELSHAKNGRGWSLIHMGRYDDSIDQFKAILKESPKHGAAKNGLGQSLLGKGSFGEAESVLLEATEEAIENMGEKNAVNAAAWYGLIRVYLQQKDYASALKWSKRFLKHGPNESIQKMADEAEKGVKEEDAEKKE